MNTYAVSKEATKIFDKIMVLYNEAISKGKEYLKLDNNPDYMYLAVEKPYRKYIISLAHYRKQNGDAMRDPEMLFLYMNGRYYPMYYRNDFMNIEQYCMFVSKSKWKVIAELQYQYSAISEIWLNNIKNQQNL